jgi:hypothetical protein
MKVDNYKSTLAIHLVSLITLLCFLHFDIQVMFKRALHVEKTDSAFFGSLEAKANAQNPTVRLDPQDSTVGVSDTFTVTVMVDDAADLGGFEFELAYEPLVVQVENVTFGDFLGSTGRNTALLGPDIDNDAGTVTFGGFSFGSEPGPDGSGALALVRLKAVGLGSSPLDLQDVQLTDTKANPQTPSVEDGMVTVSSAESWHRIYLPLILRNYP